MFIVYSMIFYHTHSYHLKYANIFSNSYSSLTRMIVYIGVWYIIFSNTLFFFCTSYDLTIMRLDMAVATLVFQMVHQFFFFYTSNYSIKFPVIFMYHCQYLDQQFWIYRNLSTKNLV